MLHHKVPLSISCLALGCKGLSSTQNWTNLKDDDLGAEKYSSLSLNSYLSLLKYNKYVLQNHRMAWVEKDLEDHHSY